MEYAHLIGDTSSKGPFSVAMLVYRSVSPLSRVSLVVNNLGLLPFIKHFVGAHPQVVEALTLKHCDLLRNRGGTSLAPYYGLGF